MFITDITACHQTEVLAQAQQYDLCMDKRNKNFSDKTEKIGEKGAVGAE